MHYNWGCYTCVRATAPRSEGTLSTDKSFHEKSDPQGNEPSRSEMIFYNTKTQLFKEKIRDFFLHQLNQCAIRIDA